MKKLSISVHALFFILIVATFSPLVIPMGKMGVTWMQMPQTLWVGVLISCLIFVLTVVQALFVDFKKR